MGLLFSGRPFSDIENEWFRRAIPGLPHRETLTQECSDFAKSTAVDLKEKLKGCEFLSIQFDIWGDRAKPRFIGVICQSLFNGAFDEYNLGTIPVDELKCGAE
jgi:hypothetical protein